MFKFCFVTDDKLTPLSKLDNYLKIIFESKVDCIQLRFKNLKTIDLYNLGKDLKKDCVKFKKTLIVNDRVDIAKSINAHVHMLVWMIYPIIKLEKYWEENL